VHNSAYAAIKSIPPVKKTFIEYSWERQVIEARIHRNSTDKQITLDSQNVSTLSFVISTVDEIVIDRYTGDTVISLDNYLVPSSIGEFMTDKKSLHFVAVSHQKA